MLGPLRRSWLGVIAVAVASCGAPVATPPAEGPLPCIEPGDCADGWTCPEGATVCCELCNSSSECTAAQACIDGCCADLANPVCQRDAECNVPGTCEQTPGLCDGGECRYAAADPGTACDPHDLCVAAATCTNQGACQGAPVACPAPEPFCRNADSEFVQYTGPGSCSPLTGECDHSATATVIPCPNCAIDCLAACADLGCTAGACETAARCELDTVGTPGCAADPVTDLAAACTLAGGGAAGFCADGECVECAAGMRNCPPDDDGNPCTENLCVAGRCVPSNHELGWPCDPDASRCELGSCTAGACVGTGQPKPSTIICRAVAGACDVLETCDDVHLACPSDVLLPDQTPCRAVADVCDVEEACDGSSPACPDDAFAAAGTPCRDTAGDCDLAEACSGQEAACPDDHFAAAGTPCRAAVDLCDAAEDCSGDAADCPADGNLAVGAPCRAADGTACDLADACNGSKACPDTKAPNGSVCSDGDLCSEGDHCTGGLCQSGEYCPVPNLPGRCCTFDVCDEVEGCSYLCTLGPC